MARYLFTLWDGGGTIPPELAVARRLVSRGHAVRILSDPTVEPEALAAGCSFSPWTTAPHRLSRAREDDVLKDYETHNPLSMISRYMREFLATPAPRWLADTCAVLDAHPVDALVSDFSVPASLIAAEARGLAAATLVPNIWMVPTPGIPPLGPGFMPARGLLGRLRDALLRGIMRRVFDRALPHLNAARASVGLSPLGSTYQQMLRAQRILVLSSPRFDFTSPAMPATVRYTGPELDDPSWCEGWRDPWSAEDRRPLVLVSLSSTFQDQVPTLRRIVAALAALELRALVTLGLGVRPDEVPAPENVVVVPSAPHAPILRRAAALVTHCGHGTTMKALAAGVPMVCLPMGRDQNDTAARVVHAGAGLRLKPTARVGVMTAAIARVLADGSFRQGAERMKATLAARDGCADAVLELEGLLPCGAGRRRSLSASSPGSAAPHRPLELGPGLGQPIAGVDLLEAGVLEGQLRIR